MKLKVFKLPSWTNNENSCLECTEARIPPILNRYGLYIDRISKFCWIECKFGCFLYNSGYKQIIYELQFLNHKPLTDKEAKAIEYLIKCKLANKELRYLYFIDKEWKDSIKRSRKGKVIGKVSK